MGRVVLHVDMDAYYAAVEVRENPDLRGRPVVVGPDPRSTGGRGVVLTASYEARAYGVRSAMPVAAALKACPDAVFVPPRFDLYRRVSEEVMEVLRGFADTLEVVGIDEAFVDVTERAGSFEKAEQIARQLKEALRQRVRLTCSVGIAPSKSVAKIASDHRKPDGLTLVRPEEVERFLAPIHVMRISGVGPKTRERLSALGVATIGQLATFPREELVEVLGAYGEYLSDVARGRDETPVTEWTGPPESIGSETTLSRETADFDALWSELEPMATDLHRSLREEMLAYRTVTLKLRYADFETHTRSRSLRVHTQELEPVLTLSRTLVRSFLDGRKVRLVGVRLSGLRREQGPQSTLARWSKVSRLP